MAWHLINGLLIPETYNLIMLGRGTFPEYRNEFINVLISHARNDPAVKELLAKRKTPVKPMIVIYDDDNL